MHGRAVMSMESYTAIYSRPGRIVGESGDSREG